MEKHRYEVTLTRADYAVGLSQVIGQLAQRDTARRKMLFARLAAYVAIFMVIGFAFPRGGSAVFSAVLLFWVAEFAIQAAFKGPTIGISFEPEVQGRTSVELSDEGIVEQGAFRTRRWTWNALRRVHLPTGYVVMEFIGWDIMILPDAVWPNGDQRSTLVAELRARQTAPALSPKSVSPGNAQARFKLTEPVLIARLFFAVEVFQLLFDTVLDSLGRPAGGPALMVMGAAFLGAAIAWWLSGWAFRWLESRSPALALRAAWGVTVFLAAVFALWFFRLI